MRVLWTRAALADVERVHDYIAAFNPPAARNIAERLFDAGYQLARSPERGRPAASGTRELTIVYPYIVVYQLGDAEIIIMRVWHGAQERS